MVGKRHLSPPEHETAAWPHERWPLGRGFERYYGFLGGDTNQWFPTWSMTTMRSSRRRAREDGYHLSVDLADRAIRDDLVCHG
jgi:arylsulfatase A-like enzyme